MKIKELRASYEESSRAKEGNDRDYRLSKGRDSHEVTAQTEKLCIGLVFLVSLCSEERNRLDLLMESHR